jgi:RNA polymerase sigma factor (sigma-70 family)
MSSLDTSLGLLARVQAGDTDAWETFSVRCRDVLVRWCQWKQVQPADAEDIYQNSMLVVVRKIRAFRHNGRGSFRAWLRAIAWRCWCDAAVGSPAEPLNELRQKFLLAQDDIAELEEEYERVRQAELMAEAMLLVRPRVRPKTWEAFCLTVLQNQSGNEVAAALHIPVYAVHSAKARVQRLISIEVRRLQHRPSRADMHSADEKPEFDEEAEGP